MLRRGDVTTTPVSLDALRRQAHEFLTVVYPWKWSSVRRHPHRPTGRDKSHGGAMSDILATPN